MLLLRTPTLVKLLRIAGLLTPIFRTTAKFVRDRDTCNEIAVVLIPHSNTSQSATHSLFVSSSTLVATENVKSLTP